MTFWLHTVDDGWQKGKDQEVGPMEEAFLAGYNLFETLKSLGRAIPFLEEHHERLVLSARVLGLPCSLSLEGLRDILEKGLSLAGFESAYVRLILASKQRDNGTLHMLLEGLQGKPETQNERLSFEPTLRILMTPLKPYPEKLYQEGIVLATSSSRARTVESLSPAYKSGNVLSSILGRMDGFSQGVQDTLFLNERGEIAETSVANLFWIKGGKLFTPPVSSGILPGITRAKIMEIACMQSLEVQERTGTAFDLYTADEIFLTNSLMDLLPVVEIDGRSVGGGKPGTLTLLLLKGYRKLLEDMVK